VEKHSTAIQATDNNTTRRMRFSCWVLKATDTREICMGGYTLVTSPRIVTPYHDSVDETRARLTYQKLVTR